MKNATPDTFVLENFEGPLDFLFHLIQKTEIDIYDVPLHKITEQYLHKLRELTEQNIDAGAEFVGTASTLLWLKSKTLLPKHEQEALIEELEADPRFEIIHQLLDYCRFKQAAKALSEREEQQSGFYLRTHDPDVKKNLGIEHLSLDDLASLFQQLLAKAEIHKGRVQEETWRVADKIDFLREQLRDQQKIEFGVLFSQNMCREELIVLFLALLELMKMGALRVVKDLAEQKVMIIP